MLTKKQQELLIFIDKRLKSGGVSPSYDEMKDALGLASKSGIHRLVTALEERGFIRRLAHRARALEVLKRPTEMAASDSKSAPVPANDTENVPLVGKIAAGVPISAIEERGDFIAAPPNMLGRGDHFALEVEGDSMVDAGILDGDIVVIRKSNTARNGEIIVAHVVEDNEATLKRLQKHSDRVELIAENKAYAPRSFGPDQIEVQGVLVGLIRHYH